MEKGNEIYNINNVKEIFILLVDLEDKVEGEYNSYDHLIREKKVSVKLSWLRVGKALVTRNNYGSLKSKEIKFIGVSKLEKISNGLYKYNYLYLKESDFYNYKDEKTELPIEHIQIKDLKLIQNN